MPFKTPLAILAAGFLALGATACGGDDKSSSSKANAKPLAEIDKLTGESTAIKIDPSFLDVLTALKITPAPVGKASLTSAGYASFPITGGNLTYYRPGSVSPYVQGEVDHDGSGLSLTAGSTRVELTDFVVNPDKSVLTGKVSVNGKTADGSATLFLLDGRTLEPLSIKTSNDTAVLVGTTVRLGQKAADLLNKAFKVDDVLTSGLAIGVARITVNAP